MKVSIGQAAKELDVCFPILRRWEAQGKIHPDRTPNGHRRYDLAQLRGLKPYETNQTNRPTLCYARVSSHDQKEDLLRQMQFCLKPFVQPTAGRTKLCRTWARG